MKPKKTRKTRRICRYCGKSNNKNTLEPCTLFENLPIVDDFTQLKRNGKKAPMQYIRKLRGKYHLVTELVNDNYDVISVKINYCLMCGRRLNN